MNLLKFLTAAGVHVQRHPEAIASLQDTERCARGLLTPILDAQELVLEYT